MRVSPGHGYYGPAFCLVGSPLPGIRQPGPRACAEGAVGGTTCSSAPGVVYQRWGKLCLTRRQHLGPQQRVKWSCGRMSADSVAVVIVSAARTAIGEWPVGPARPQGPLGRLGPSETPHASPAAGLTAPHPVRCGSFLSAC